MDEEYKTCKSVPVFSELFLILRILSVVTFLYISQNPMVGGSNKFNSRSFQIFFCKRKEMSEGGTGSKTENFKDFSSLSDNLSEFSIYIIGRFCRLSKNIRRFCLKNFKICCNFFISSFQKKCRDSALHNYCFFICSFEVLFVKTVL